MRTVLVFIAAGLSAVALSAVVQLPMHKRIHRPTQKKEIVDRSMNPKFLQYEAQGTGSAPISDYFDNYYMTNVTIGTPPQTFSLLVDTGSSNIYIVGADCTADACAGDEAYRKTKFDYYASSTFSWFYESIKITYGNGICTGNVGTDEVGLGGITISQSFGVCLTLSGELAHVPFDGVLGLAWPSFAFFDVTPPILSLAPQLDEPLFAVWLDRHVKSVEGQLGGLITYGATDAVNCDAEINYVRLSSKSYWQFRLDSFGVNGYTTSGFQQAISDTGFSYFGAPPAAFRAIVAATGAKLSTADGAYVLPCAGNYPDLVFRIGGVEYKVQASEYVLDQELASGKCVLAATVNSSGGGFAPDWILGDTWIRAYCNIYDIGQARVGFARARHAEI